MLRPSPQSAPYGSFARGGQTARVPQKRRARPQRGGARFACSPRPCPAAGAPRGVPGSARVWSRRIAKTMTERCFLHDSDPDLGNGLPCKEIMAETFSRQGTKSWRKGVSVTILTWWDGAATKSPKCPIRVICKGWSNCTRPPKAACAPPEGGGSFRLLSTTLPSCRGTPWGAWVGQGLVEKDCQNHDGKVFPA